MEKGSNSKKLFCKYKSAVFHGKYFILTFHVLKGPCCGKDTASSKSLAEHLSKKIKQYDERSHEHVSMAELYSQKSKQAAKKLDKHKQPK